MTLDMACDRVDDPADTTPSVTRVRSSTPLVDDLIGRAYLAHYRDVFRYVLVLTRSSMDAEEIASEVFERAIRAWTSGPPDPPLPWLLLTARRIATDRWRRARRLRSVLRRGSNEVARDQESTEFWVWFDAVSRVLTNRQREALVLRFQRDLSDAEIASIMSLSESGVRSLVARALDVLRSHPEIL
jgi:RNA polymerase sigma factor (sigma-70 family)